MSASNLPSLSRRTLLINGLAGAAIAAIPEWASADISLPTVRPIWSHKAYQAFGVCSHPNFSSSVYQYTRQWMTSLAATGASYFRGMYADGLPATDMTARAAREHGLEWGMAVCPDDWSLSDQELAARIQHVAQHAADVCLYIEGVNEPNYERGGGAPPGDWPQRTLAKQKVIWQAVKSDPRLAHVKVVGPSLQAVVGTESQYRMLGDVGIAQYMDFAAMHRYPGGRYPNHMLDEQLTWIRRHWGGKATWITETGYTNALASPGGHSPVPEDVSAGYAPSALLEAVDRGCKVCWFELLDDPDSGVKDVTESNFGMFATTSGMAPPWRPKPVVEVMKSFLSELRDAGPTYDPAPIGLHVTSDVDDVEVTVLGKRNGSVTVHLRRATNCWDPVKQERIPVKEAPVTVRTEKGSRTFTVNHEVRSVTL